MKKTGISQAQLAAELNVHRSTILRYVRAGMPANADGSLDRAAALEWIRANVASFRGGWHFRGKEQNTADVAGFVLEDMLAEYTDPRITLYEEIRSRLSQVPGVLLELDPKLPPWVVVAAIEALDSLLGAFVFDIDRELISDDQAPVTEPKYRTLLKRSGVTLDRKAWNDANRLAEAFVDKLDAVLDRYCTAPCGGNERPEPQNLEIRRRLS
jgi:hypothetical protein